MVERVKKVKERGVVSHRIGQVLAACMDGRVSEICVYRSCVEEVERKDSE
jgi:hypothetical protein